MRNNLYLVNVSSELLLDRVSGNLPVTAIASLVRYGSHLTIYQLLAKQVGEPNLKERKHFRQFTHTY